MFNKPWSSERISKIKSVSCRASNKKTDSLCAPRRKRIEKLFLFWMDLQMREKEWSFWKNLMSYFAIPIKYINNYKPPSSWWVGATGCQKNQFENLFFFFLQHIEFQIKLYIWILFYEEVKIDGWDYTQIALKYLSLKRISPEFVKNKNHFSETERLSTK